MGPAQLKACIDRLKTINAAGSSAALNAIKDVGIILERNIFHHNDHVVLLLTTTVRLLSANVKEDGKVLELPNFSANTISPLRGNDDNEMIVYDYSRAPVTVNLKAHQNTFRLELPTISATDWFHMVRGAGNDEVELWLLKDLFFQSQKLRALVIHPLQRRNIFPRPPAPAAPAAP